jgi:hypothetical protein
VDRAGSQIRQPPFVDPGGKQVPPITQPAHEMMQLSVGMSQL